MARNKFTTSIEEEYIEQLKILAAKERCNVADILNKVIREFLDKAEK